MLNDESLKIDADEDVLKADDLQKDEDNMLEFDLNFDEHDGQ